MKRWEEILNEEVAEIEEGRTNAKRFAARGLTFSTSDELEALLSEGDYEENLEKIRSEMAEYSKENPVTATVLEVAGAIPTSLFGGGLLARGGVKLAGQGAIEGGIYGFASGEGVEDRVMSSMIGATVGAAVGKGLDKAFDGSLGKLKDPKLLREKQLDIKEKALKEAKVERVTPDIDDYDLGDQLLLREVEFLGDVVGRRGMSAEQAYDEFFNRLKKYGEDMGVDSKKVAAALNKNKTLKDLRAMLKEADEDSLPQLREDLIEATTGRLAADTAETVRDAQSLVVKFRRVASPIATLAEETVGPAFASRIIRGMNRVTRKQVELDEMWKGMEAFRTLAQNNRAFNNALLNAVNAENIGQEAADAALRKAYKIAERDIGGDAVDRLKKFFADNHNFSARYRQEVTAGELTPTWMHSAVKTADTDNTLRRYRKRAQGSEQDTASQQRLRQKLDDNDDSYQNIFDSHWQWQRQALTRMELGNQLGFRTVGKSTSENLTREQIKKLPKDLKRRIKEGELSPREAWDIVEAKPGKLYDPDVVAETFRREGYSEQQIQNAMEILDDLSVNANKGMAAELDIIRSFGYVGTIANPYGALMNVHDLFNASFELGARNVIKAIFDKNGVKFSPNDMGLARQVFGEFVRKARRGESKTGSEFVDELAQASNKLLEWSMKASGFAGLDKFGKSKIMKASFNKARRDIADGTFDNKWANTFSRGELDQLKRDIASENDSELVRDLVMFDLFRLQPINAAAQTAFGLQNPNARLFYMLKGFAIKQFDLMERRIIKEWRKGNKKEALNNLMKYMVVSGGGYGVVNEGRQVAKFETPDPAAIPVAALYQIGSVATFGAMGANDYGYDKFMDDPLLAMGENLIPPVGATLPGAVVKDIAEAARTGSPLPDETIFSLPVVGKTLKGVFE